MEKNEKKLSYGEALRRNHRAMKLWWEKAPGIFLSGAAVSVCKAVSPYVTIYLSAQIINELAGARNSGVLWRLVWMELISAVLLNLAGAALERWAAYEQRSSGFIHNKIYMEKMLALDYSDIEQQHIHDLQAQITGNRNWSGWGLGDVIETFEKMIAAVMRIVGGICLSISLFALKIPETSGKLMFLNHPFFAVSMFILMIGTAVLAAGCGNRGRNFWIKYADEAVLGNRYLSFFGCAAYDRKRAADMRIYGQQEKICSHYLKQGKQFQPGSLIAKWAKGPMGFWQALAQGIAAALTGVIYLFVCLKAWAGAFGVGSVTQYVGAVTSMFLGISQLLQNIGKVRANAEFLGVCYELLDVPNRMYQGSLTTEKRTDRQYEVEFRDVSFQYPGSETYALRHVNMKFKVGSRLAVVGMNGSGKTTFIKLLCRLYDPTEGQILLNGIDIRKYRYDDYINIFSVVFQDFKLFALPIGQNVAGAAEYDRRGVEDSLMKAGFTDRMKDMPKGLDTYLYKELEKDGVDISGGEAQKIAIARALYKDAPFIILDEPTAALDPIAEAEIYSRFNEIAGDRTAVYISHRLSSCKFCDEIAVFHEGAVIQQGTHEELVADEKGKYYELWHAQAQYYTQ